LFGLYTVVALLYAALPEANRRGSVSWPGKAGVTFSDALTAVRRWLWAARLSKNSRSRCKKSCSQPLPQPRKLHQSNLDQRGPSARPAGF
jgi:hypothetical protein